jgi:hypothetical protein
MNDKVTNVIEEFLRLHAEKDQLRADNRQLEWALRDVRGALNEAICAMANAETLVGSLPPNEIARLLRWHREMALEVWERTG